MGGAVSTVNDVVILSAARTPIGRFQGALAGVAAVRLGAIAVKAAVDRACPQDVDEVILGNVVQAGSGQAPARQASIFGGLPASVGATTVNKVCGSGLKAAMMAAQAIRTGDGHLFVAGGFESMSRAPYLVPGRTGELRYGHTQLTDALVHDGLWDPFEDWGMGNAADFIAEVRVMRQDMDVATQSSVPWRPRTPASSRLRSLRSISLAERARSRFRHRRGPSRRHNRVAGEIEACLQARRSRTAGNSSTLVMGLSHWCSHLYGSQGTETLARVVKYAGGRRTEIPVRCSVEGHTETAREGGLEIGRG
jgi:acetyl-CoA acetyltransferase